MNKEQIIDIINGFLVEEFEADPESILPESDMRKTLDLDSLDYIDLVVIIENNFGFKVKPDDFTSILSFQDFYNYVEQRITDSIKA